MQVNYVNIYINNHNTTRQVAAPKPTDFRLFLRNNVTSFRYIICPHTTSTTLTEVLRTPRLTGSGFETKIF